MSKVVVFVLDSTTGRPAEGLGVCLQRLGSDGEWLTLAEGTTRETGEVPELAADELLIEPGVYRLVYATHAYFDALGVPHFHPQIVVRFTGDDEPRYVLPLILTPFGYSVYRGS